MLWCHIPFCMWCHMWHHNIGCDVTWYDVTYMLWCHTLKLWCHIPSRMWFANRHIWHHIPCLCHHIWRHVHFFSFWYAYSGFIPMNLNFLLDLLNVTFARAHRQCIHFKHKWHCLYSRNKGNPFSKLHPLPRWLVLVRGFGFCLMIMTKDVMISHMTLYMTSHVTWGMTNRHIHNMRNAQTHQIKHVVHVGKVPWYPQALRAYLQPLFPHFPAK